MAVELEFVHKIEKNKRQMNEDGGRFSSKENKKRRGGDTPTGERRTKGTTKPAYQRSFNHSVGLSKSGVRLS